MSKLIYCNGNMRCIMLTIPSSMLMPLILVKLYTCQFNSNKVCQYQNLYYTLVERCLLEFLVSFTIAIF